MSSTTARWTDPDDMQETNVSSAHLATTMRGATARATRAGSRREASRASRKIDAGARRSSPTTRNDKRGR
ncbi:hypothetical protein PQJ75_03000 [Rhodoplanes sp. TEM]|uniref:Uncharacterized protein n=1 Tax=Rhodoplanes tepidamans TaxID=200616 RepID=A0ABT5JGJ1_RHOTP|nr:MULTISPECIES: hypothetical protein [Rhodoplanes]MDC7788699.1 hypothetical protein [Rhodoplanes tepidamans]MDC7982691.1 hypothetical protein [Rhodoplanes sp. TEM]MDQ0357662.1 hypothetical protein [Rhodoplanes tepidamans]